LNIKYLSIVTFDQKAFSRISRFLTTQVEQIIARLGGASGSQTGSMAMPLKKYTFYFRLGFRSIQAKIHSIFIGLKVVYNEKQWRSARWLLLVMNMGRTSNRGFLLFILPSSFLQ